MAYDNSARAARAGKTRVRVLAAARASFLARGFAGTTIGLVADEAGVSQETIYKTLGSKARLLKAVYDVTLAGDDDDVPLVQRPEALAVLHAPSGEEAIAAYAKLAQTIAARTDPLVRMIMGSRDTDTSLMSFVNTIHEERRKGSAFWVQHWRAAGWLREDLDVERAADILWALNSYEPRWLLADRGWSADEFVAWFAETLRHALLRGTHSHTSRR
ncbi:MAG: TetR/AcrR family transcriptional regulator [Acidimicrobiales bacterium]